MSAGLAASTVTPGMTAPVESWTTPTILARSWAFAGPGATIPAATTHPIARRITSRRMSASPDVVRCEIVGRREPDVNQCYDAESRRFSFHAQDAHRCHGGRRHVGGRN